jgi:hypothetical protein
MVITLDDTDSGRAAISTPWQGTPGRGADDAADLRGAVWFGALLLCVAGMVECVVREGRDLVAPRRRVSPVAPGRRGPHHPSVVVAVSGAMEPLLARAAGGGSGVAAAKVLRGHCDPLAQWRVEAVEELGQDPRVQLLFEVGVVAFVECVHVLRVRLVTAD